MKLRIAFGAMLVCLLGLLTIAGAKNRDTKNDSSSSAPSTHASLNDPEMRLEGEKRFHSNCSRCHAAPPKFPPRMMGTIVRHMRVRAMLTDEDMHFILRYMSK